jgi:RNA-directed DNA polymerase
MYVTSQLEESWLLNEQRKLYTRSWETPDYVFEKLWGLVTDPRNLRTATARVARNKGRNTPGVDRVTVRTALRNGIDRYVDGLRAQLRTGAYRPKEARRVFIPKPGQPGKFRPLGIPTVNDRVVQAAVKNIMEPIFEADFYPTSHGFRPGHSAHGALEHLRVLLMPRRTKSGAYRSPYQWVVEGDIKGCFDNISHHGLMERVRSRIRDAKVNRLVLAFLKAGVLTEGTYLPTDAGTPQGGILSPLLANIALTVLDERYERHAFPRKTPTLLTDRQRIEERTGARRQYDRTHGIVRVPIRYADDFIILISAPDGADEFARAETAAHEEKAAVADLLHESLHLELSEAKTLVTPVTGPMKFLGHHVRVRDQYRRGLACAVAIPKEKSHQLRERIKDIFRRSTIHGALSDRLRILNPLLRGWAYYYRHAWRAKRVFSRIDHYVWWTIYRWIRKKHPRKATRACVRAYAWRKPGRRYIRWRHGSVFTFAATTLSTGHFRLWELQPPGYARTLAESPVHNERCTPGSEGGVRKPTPR